MSLETFVCCHQEARIVEHFVQATDRVKAAVGYRAATGCWPDYVGDDSVFDICSQCEMPLFRDEPHVIEKDGTAFCSRCDIKRRLNPSEAVAGDTE